MTGVSLDRSTTLSDAPPSGPSERLCANFRPAGSRSSCSPPAGCRPHGPDARRRPRRPGALAAERGGRRARGVRPVRAGAGRWELAAVLALLRLPGPGPGRAALGSARGRLGARAVPGRRDRAARSRPSTPSTRGRSAARASSAARAGPSSTPPRAPTRRTSAPACAIGMWPDPNDEADGEGAAVVPRLVEISALVAGLHAARLAVGRLARPLVGAARAGLAARSGLPAVPLGPGGLRRLRPGLSGGVR